LYFVFCILYSVFCILYSLINRRNLENSIISDSENNHLIKSEILIDDKSLRKWEEQVLRDWSHWLCRCHYHRYCYRYCNSNSRFDDFVWQWIEHRHGILVDCKWWLQYHPHGMSKNYFVRHFLSWFQRARHDTDNLAVIKELIFVAQEFEVDIQNKYIIYPIYIYVYIYRMYTEDQIIWPCSESRY
jgi:hypothetical protein